MYKLLIVDDEAIIREGMKNLVPWPELNIAEVFTAGSAREALDILEEHEPEIMITDINMPEISGIELIEKAYAVQPLMRAIVLTGYDYFEYARDAVRLHVQDYLLKPIDEKALIESVKRQIEALDREVLSGHMRRAEGLSSQIELEMRIHMLLEGRDDADNVRLLEKNNRIPADVRIQCAVIYQNLHRFDSKEERKLYFDQLHAFVLGEIDLKLKGFTVSTDREDGLIIIFRDDQSDNSIEENFRNLLSLIESEFSEVPRAALGTEVIGIRNIGVSLNEALRLLSNNDTTDSYLLPPSFSDRSRLYRDVYMEMGIAMANSISDPPYVLRIFDAFLKAADAYQRSDSDLRRDLFHIISDLSFNCALAGIRVPNNLLSQLSEILFTAGREECGVIGKQYISNLVTQEYAELNEIVSRAKEYINCHLGEELTVTDIASRLFVSPNYFSRLFKKHTGEGCNEYIVRKRMDKAKSLLEATELNTGKIANMVGYNDTNYFSMAFKKNCMMSPTAYRNSVRSGK